MPLDWPLFEDDAIGTVSEGEDTDTPVYVTFDLAGQTLAVSVTQVREIINRATITRLPGAPEDVAGLVDLRGASVPIIDMDRRLGLPARDKGRDARIIVFEIAGAEGPRPVGFEADRVLSVLPIPDADIEPITAEMIHGAWEGRMLRGIYRSDGAMIVVLDPLVVLTAADANLT